MNGSRASVIISALFGKILSIIGYGIGALDLCVISVGLSDMDSEGAVLGMMLLLIVLGLCIFFVFKGAKIKRRIKRFKKYIFLISSSHMTSLDNIAFTVSKPVDFIKKDLQEMIDKKFFTKAFIDMRTNEIIIGGLHPVTSNTGYPPQNDLRTETETAACSGCGAVNIKPKGSVTNCEYCGSLIK